MRPTRHERERREHNCWELDQSQSYPLVLPEATNSSTIRVSFGGESPQSVRARAAGRDFDGVKSTLTEVGSNPSMVWRFRHDERRHAGSAFNIENHGENHASALN
jgi:hypothetical protein